MFNNEIHYQMIVTRIYADEKGESHFDEVEYPLHDQGDIGFLSEEIPATGIVFRETSGGYDYDFHVAPKWQYIVLLDGEIEIETSLGEKRRFKGGEILLVEDTWGKGHKTRSLSDGTRRSVFVTLE
ncbi:MAG: hypothetical protein AB2L24_00715 [Mangrovibacterium sp.]